MMKPPVAAAFFLAAAVVAASSASAELVERVWWNPRFDAPGGTDPFPGQTTDAALAEPGTLTQTGLARSGNSFGTIGFSNVPTTLSDNHYIEFSLIPGPGRELEIDGLLLQGARSQGLPMPIDRIVLRTSVDGFASDVAAQAGPNNLIGNTGRPISFDLDHLPTLQQETTFRLHMWNTGGSFGIVGSVATRGHGLWFGDVASNPVPAPAAATIPALSGLVATRRRRK